MRILDALMQWAGLSEPSLEDVLIKAGEASPDLKPSADLLLEKLRADITPEGIADVALALPGEGLNILKLKLEPEDHASDHI